MGKPVDRATVDPGPVDPGPVDRATVDVAAELDLIEEAFGRIVRSGTLEHLHRRIVARLGARIDPGAYLVLRWINDIAPVRPSRLAAALGVEPPTITRHLQRLERDGLVVRRPDPSDRRAMLAELTGRGRQVVAGVEEERQRILHGILGRWTPEERARFAQLLTRFSADFIAVAESA